MVATEAATSLQEEACAEADGKDQKPSAVPDAGALSAAERKEALAKCRNLYSDAGPFVESLQLRRAAPGSYLALEPLVLAFIRRSGADPDTKAGAALRKASFRALSGALLHHFGEDLPHVLLARGSCPHTQIRSSPAFAIESDDFPARPVRLEAGEAKAVRERRREQRAKDGDLAVRPTAERGYGAVEEAPAADSLSEGSSKYLSELLKLECGPQLLKMKLYPDAKELTESFAAFHAVRKHLGAAFAPEDAAVTVVCVGDGSLPRTAALFAFRTRWRCYAVDPQMKAPGEQWGGTDRLWAQRAKIEDCHFEADKLVVVCVHAHVGLAQCLAVMDWKKAVGIVAIPCCNYYNSLQMPNPGSLVAEYHDSGIVSPHRLVRVYSLDK